MQFRELERRDLAGILAMNNAEIADGVAHFGTQKQTFHELEAMFDGRDRRHPWLVARDGDVVGYALASEWKSHGAYRWTAELGVYVRPSHHRKGIARILVTELIRQLEDNRVRTLIAGIALPNDASIRLFEGLNFTAAGTLPAVGFKAGTWHDVGYWTRHIGQGDPTTK